MISSRCKTKFPFDNDEGTELSEIRKKLKKELQNDQFCGKPLLNVWINEEETEDGSQTSWEACIKQAETCDVFISILDGAAGWQIDKSGIGICHAEFEAAHSKSPGKVRVISLADESGKLRTKEGPDSNFVNAVSKANLMEGRGISDVETLIDKVKQTVRELVLQLGHEGARELKRSGPNTGQALDWSRMNYTERHNAMKDVLVSSLALKPGAETLLNGVKLPVCGKWIYLNPTAIPAAFNISAAREMVGQPFLRDHEASSELGTKIGGPVHIIACHKGVTEAQAINLLGFPDATIVSGTFGVYVADNVQKIQLCLIANCKDAASTKHGLQKLFDWLKRTGEDMQLSSRALSRAKILKVIADEVK